MDIGSISAVLAGIKSASDIAKIIKDSSSSLEQAEVKFQLAELISALADAKIEVANVREAVADKDDLIKELSQKLNLKENIIWHKPYYFVMQGEDKDGPFCQKCYDSDQQLIRLQGQKGHWECHECKNMVSDENYDVSPIKYPRNSRI
jgi:NAD-dependent SIR2 family protein deacetylase